MFNAKNIKSESGYVLILTVALLIVVFVMMGALLSYATSQIASHRSAVAKEQALNISEAGLEMAIWKLNNQGGYNGETDTSYGNGVYTISIASVNSNTKTVTVTGYVPNSTKPVAHKTIKITAGINNTVISFRYGVQAGAGGFSLSGGSTINGSVYSNGNINATTGVHITGSAVAANQPALAVDQVNDTPLPISSCTASTCITFANTSATQDFAQSFKISSATALNNIQFYIKKVGAPSNATVRIVTDNSGSPSSNTLMSGTLVASGVTGSFGWVTVPMPSTPILDPTQTYWVVIDAGSSSSKYYIIGANSGGYSNGVAKVGRYGVSWSSTSPSGLDGYFKIYLGGWESMIGGNNYTTGVYVGTTVSDDAWAHTVQGATVTGTIYCKTSSYTNPLLCNTTKPDPSPQPMPLSDGNIQDWKDDAVVGGTHVGDYHVDWRDGSIGPKKITGNLLVDGGGTLTLTGTLWVQGTITLTGGAKLKLATSYGANSGAIVSDGYVKLIGGSSFYGSGTTGSYPFLITTSNCPVGPNCAGNTGNNAIYLSGGAGTVALIAQNGTVQIEGGSSLKEVTANQIIMNGGAELEYDSGLISENFSSGPGGSWKIMPQTWQLLE